MYYFFHSILSDKKGGEIFTLFSAWHFIYIALTLAVIVVVLLFLKDKDREAKTKAERRLIGLAVGLYVADGFLMPLAYGEIDIEKLPFHACTAMCVACFLSYRVKPLEKYRISLAMLGFISNLVYLVYPAGVMWHAVHPLSYRVIQTLIFHGIMTVYGLVTLVNSRESLSIKGCRRDLAVIGGMTAWAMLGNYVYNGTSEGYSHFFNWFFVVRDPFYAIPAKVAPFVMPLLNVVIFFAAESIVYLIFYILNQLNKRK